MAHQITWSERYITLTSEKIYIRNKEKGDIKDEISLLEITRTSSMNGSFHNIHKTSSGGWKKIPFGRRSDHEVSSPEMCKVRQQDDSSKRRAKRRAQHSGRDVSHHDDSQNQSVLAESSEEVEDQAARYLEEGNQDEEAMVQVGAKGPTSIKFLRSSSMLPIEQKEAKGSGTTTLRELQWENTIEIYLADFGRNVQHMRCPCAALAININH